MVDAEAKAAKKAKKAEKKALAEAAGVETEKPKVLPVVGCVVRERRWRP